MEGNHKHYPDRPGFKEPTTSADAARTVASDAQVLRHKVLAEIRAAGASGLSAHQCATRLGRDKLSVSPRLSELRKAGKICPASHRRKNESGISAIVWIAAAVQ